MRPACTRVLVVVVLAASCVLAAAPTAFAAPSEAAKQAAAWHEALLDDVAPDLIAGRPLVIQVHVPLCSNHVLRCGGHGLGDGDAPAQNLYWATRGGFVGWFGRKGSAWKPVLVARAEQVAGAGGAAAAEKDVLEVRAWRRRVTPGDPWKRRGVKRPFDVVVVAYAWRGTAIDRTVEAYVGDLYGSAARTVTLAGGTKVAAGGAAHVVSYVGHNRWMDYETAYDFAAAAAGAGAGAEARPKGTVAIACKTADYLAEGVSAAARVPLLMTTDFMFAGAHGFDGAVSAFAEGRSLAAIRAGAAARYAEGQGKDVKRVSGAFTNPADPRWQQPKPR